MGFQLAVWLFPCQMCCVGCYLTEETQAHRSIRSLWVWVAEGALLQAWSHGESTSLVVVEKLMSHSQILHEPVSLFCFPDNVQCRWFGGFLYAKRLALYSHAQRLMCDWLSSFLGMLWSATKPTVLSGKPEQIPDVFQIEKPFQATQKQFCLSWPGLRKESSSLWLDWS